MTKKHYITISIGALSILFGGCQQRVFGLDEAVWNTLNQQEREKVIDGYNKRKEIELVNSQKQKEKELENEHHRQEVEAQTAPIYAAADAVSSIWGHSAKESRSDCFPFIRIQSVSTNKGKQILTIGDDQFEVSAFSKMSHAWVKGQKVELTKNDADFLYPVAIKNIDNGEKVIAKKSKRS